MHQQRRWSQVVQASVVMVEREVLELLVKRARHARRHQQCCSPVENSPGVTCLGIRCHVSIDERKDPVNPARLRHFESKGEVEEICQVMSSIVKCM